MLSALDHLLIFLLDFPSAPSLERYIAHQKPTPFIVHPSVPSLERYIAHQKPKHFIVHPYTPSLERYIAHQKLKPLIVHPSVLSLERYIAHQKPKPFIILKRLPLKDMLLTKNLSPLLSTLPITHTIFAICRKIFFEIWFWKYFIFNE